MSILLISVSITRDHSYETPRLSSHTPDLPDDRPTPLLLLYPVNIALIPFKAPPFNGPRSAYRSRIPERSAVVPGCQDARMPDMTCVMRLSPEIRVFNIIAQGPISWMMCFLNTPVTLYREVAIHYLHNERTQEQYCRFVCGRNKRTTYTGERKAI